MRNEGQRVAVFPGALPSGWATATIGDIIGCDGLFVDGDWVESKDQDPKGDVRLTQLADVGDGVYRNRSNRFLKYKKAVQLGCTFLQPNDLMIARMPDPLGRACIFPGDSKPSVTAVDVCIVRTGLHGADHPWLMYIINSPIFRSAIASLQSGSTRKRISRSNLAKIEFPLPPLPEQHRIIAKIEELFTRLDAGIDELNKIKLQLKQYRQAVLKHAFAGKLTEEWREAHKGEMEPASVLLERRKNAEGKNRELPPLGISDLRELPEGWVWTRLSEISEITLGQSPPSSTYNENGNGLPFYQGKLEFGDIYPTARKWCSSPKKIAEKGDVLISVRAPVGPTNICPDKSCIGRGLAAIRGLNGIEAIFMLYLMRAFAHNLSLRRTGTTFDAITGDVLREFTIPLPPLPEQHKIVEEIERCFSVADKTEKVVEQSLKQAERLRQSILKRAFEGKLVPQNPTDEPAEKLLERIKAEKAKREVEKKATGESRNKLNTIQRRLM